MMKLRFERVFPLMLILFLIPVTAATSRNHEQAQDDSTRSTGIDVLLVVDTQTGPAGIKANEGLMLSFLESVKAMTINVNVTRIRAGRISPGGIISEIRKLDANRLRSRTLVFYYAGHGGTDPKIGHFLRTPAGDLPRSVLLSEIRAKSPRLAIVLTDCCSTRVTVNAPLAPAPPPPERRAVENLLLQHRGVVDVNGSSSKPEAGIYQAAFYNPAAGGLFTYAFCSMFEPHTDRFGKDLPDDEPWGASETIGFARRFDAVDLWRYDRDSDGFVEWSEAIRYLNSTVMSLYEDFKLLVKARTLTIQARPDDVRMLMSQVSQDPQVFGPLAVRTDKPSQVESPPVPSQPVRKPRFGAYLEDRVARGGAYVEVIGVDRSSPAMRVFVWKNGRRGNIPVPMAVGDTIAWANHVRVRSREDFFHAIETIPEGGELNITGLDQGSGRRSKYEATVLLDRFE